MRINKLFIELIAIVTIGGATYVPSFAYTAPMHVSAKNIHNHKKKSHITTTTNTISVYNAKNLKDGDHYIPAGVAVHYRKEHNGIRVWSDSKEPKYNHHYEYYLRHNKKQKYMVTYGSINNLGLKRPLTQKQKIRYKNYQKRINKKMSKMFNKHKHTSSKKISDYGPAPTTSHESRSKQKNTHQPTKNAQEKNDKKIKQHKKNLAKKKDLRNKRRHAALLRKQRRHKELLKLHHNYEQGKHARQNRPIKHTPIPTHNESGSSRPQGSTLPKTSEQPTLLNDIMDLL